jgi:hypothetical protein
VQANLAAHASSWRPHGEAYDAHLSPERPTYTAALEAALWSTNCATHWTHGAADEAAVWTTEQATDRSSLESALKATDRAAQQAAD